VKKAKDTKQNVSRRQLQWVLLQVILLQQFNDARFAAQACSSNYSWHQLRELADKDVDGFRVMEPKVNIQLQFQQQSRQKLSHSSICCMKYCRNSGEPKSIIHFPCICPIVYLYLHSSMPAPVCVCLLSINKRISTANDH